MPNAEHERDSTPPFLHEVVSSVFGAGGEPAPIFEAQTNPAPVGDQSDHTPTEARGEGGEGGEGLSEVWESWSRMVEGEPSEPASEREAEFEIDLRAVGGESEGTAVAVEEVPPEPTEAPTGDQGDLEHPSPEHRVAALRRMREDPQSAPVVAVTARLQDPHPDVRVAAVEVLESLGDEEVLMVLLEALSDPSEEVRTAAREAFRRRHSDSLTRLLSDRLSEPGRARTVARLLADVGETATLIEAARTGDPSVRRVVIEALEQSGAIRELVLALEDRRPERRRAACEQIGALGAPEGVEPLVTRLSDPDAEVRITAAGALATISDRSALHALKRSYIWDPDPAVVVAVGDAIRAISDVSSEHTTEM